MPRILLVDDDDQFRTMLNLVLKRAGYEVMEARNGNEAIKIYHQNPTDLVITDIVMPDKEGLELIMEFHRDYPEARIIAISGGGRGSPLDYLQVARRFGVRRTLAKPFSNGEILEAVRDVVYAGE